MITGDSAEYNLLAKWADQLSPRDFYLTVEIGVREGYGSDVIMENLKNRLTFTLVLILTEILFTTTLICLQVQFLGGQTLKVIYCTMMMGLTRYQRILIQ